MKIKSRRLAILSLGAAHMLCNVPAWAGDRATPEQQATDQALCKEQA